MLYFIGVSTQQSSIMRVFPVWARELGLGDAGITGMDFAPGAPAAAFRDAVAYIKHTPHARGALITTHKLDVFNACRDLFDEIRPHAAMLAETSCLFKRGQKFCCDAKDLVNSGFACDAIVPAGHFAQTRAHALILGAGGAATALSWHLLQAARGADRPARITVTDVSAERLAHLRALHARLQTNAPVDYVHVSNTLQTDALLGALPPGSLVVNATGMGKDRPGSPISDSARFPERGYVWELNYRGELGFLAQARAQQAARALTVTDGWHYFIHGWTSVIADVYDAPIATSGPQFERLSALAAEASGRASS